MKKYLKIVLYAVIALILVACGNGGGSPEESATSTESAATTSENGDVQEITVAVENGAQPLSYVDENGDLVGYEVDLINAIDEQLENYSITIENVDGEASQVGLDTGKYAFIGGGLYKTDEREERYLFPEEHTGASVIEIYRRTEDDHIQTLDDLSGVTVHPVTPNGGIFNMLVSYNEENPDNQIDIQQGEQGNYAERFQAIDNGTSDALVMPSNLGASDIIEQLDLNVTTADEPVAVNPTYFMLRQDETELKEQLDEAIHILKDDGTLSDISQKWYGEDIFEYEITSATEE